MKKNLSRRHFIRTTACMTAGLSIMPLSAGQRQNYKPVYPVRPGGPVPGNFSDPAEWVKAVRALGYSAAYCPGNRSESRNFLCGLNSARGGIPKAKQIGNCKTEMS